MSSEINEPLDLTVKSDSDACNDLQCMPKKMISITSKRGKIDDATIPYIHPCLVDIYKPSDKSLPTKRMRLKELSPSEREEYRKSYNRGASQKQRDKQKAIIEKLENRVIQYNADKERLQNEIFVLRTKNKLLQDMVDQLQLQCVSSSVLLLPRDCDPDV